MINIYILWHFGHFFGINISTATCVLWFFSFLFIKKKIKNQKVYWNWYCNIDLKNIDYRIEFEQYVIAHH